MNYLIRTDPPAIFTTPAAVDGSTVFGSLKMARVALDGEVDAELERIAEDLAKDMIVLKFAANERYHDLRAARKAAQEGIALRRQLTQSGPAQEAPSAASHTPAPDPAPAGGADTAGAPVGTITSLALASGDPGPPGNGWEPVQAAPPQQRPRPTEWEPDTEGADRRMWEAARAALAKARTTTEGDATDG